MRRRAKARASVSGARVKGRAKAERERMSESEMMSERERESARFSLHDKEGAQTFAERHPPYSLVKGGYASARARVRA